MHDAYIAELADAVDNMILAYCGQPTLTWATHTHAFDIEGAGQNEIALRCFPVAEVASVVDAGTTLAQTAWYLDSRTGFVRRTGSGRFFTQGAQKVSVVYTAGHTAASPGLNTLAHAATVWAASWFNASRHAGMRSESGAGYRYSADPDEVPAQVRSMLAGYTRIIPRDSAP